VPETRSGLGGVSRLRVAEAAYGVPVDELALRVAAAERKGFRLQRLGQYEKALMALEKLMGDEALKSDPQRRAWLAASAARIAYQMEDEAKGQKLQTNAFSVNNNHSPPRVRAIYVPRPVLGKQAAAIVARLLEYSQRAALVSEFDVAVVDLVPEASANQYELALANLGLHLGFDAERPEKVHGVGPDVLWRTDATFDFVIKLSIGSNGSTPVGRPSASRPCRRRLPMRRRRPPGAMPSGSMTSPKS
jgi:hypothetical protein